MLCVATMDATTKMRFWLIQGRTSIGESALCGDELSLLSGGNNVQPEVPAGQRKVRAASAKSKWRMACGKMIEVNSSAPILIRHCNKYYHQREVNRPLHKQGNPGATIWTSRQQRVHLIQEETMLETTQ